MVTLQLHSHLRVCIPRHISLRPRRRSRHTASSPRRLRELALSLVIGVPLVDWEVVLSITKRVLDARSLFDSLCPFVEPRPHCTVVALRTCGRDVETAFEVIEYPEPDLYSISKLHA